jgi:ssDNA thymidine ADP-ribosyltransferase, DarT
VSAPPARPKIYHITHVDNLRSIVSEGVLVSDAAMIARGGPAAAIGMSTIKERRLSLPVDCHAGDSVGDYVPFYFCPRSIMLYVIHCRNHPDLSYRNGQGPIVHLEADMQDVVAWANRERRRWAFSLSNAGAAYAQFRARIAELDQINWDAIAATDFRSSEVKEGKQAEFLVHESFPWTLVSRIGVVSAAVKAQAEASMAGAVHQPLVHIQRDWYY